MKHAFVLVPTDIGAIRSFASQTVRGEVVFCSSTQDLATVVDADEIHFVVSRVAMCSTVLQELIYAIWKLCDPSRFRLLVLEETHIPAGAARLESLPKSDFDA